MSWYNASWDYRVKVTVQNGQVDSDLTDYPVYVDLSDLPAGFFTNVDSAGADIRVTKSDGSTELPVEVVAIDTSGSTGELHFKASGTDEISSTSDTDFYIYYGNSGASAYADNATYGAENVWTNGYGAVLHLEASGDGTAGEFKDSTSNDNDGQGGDGNTSYVPTQSSSGKLGGNCQDFTNNGTAVGDNITVPDSATVDPTTNWTLSAWVKQDVTTEQHGIIEKYDWAASKGNYGLRINASNKIQVFKVSGRGATSEVYDASTVDTNWHFIVGSYDSTANSLKSYLDNSTESSSCSLDDYGSDTDMKIGARGDDRTNSFDGLIDEVRVSTVTRTDDWLGAVYNNQSSPSTFYNVGSQETGGTDTSSEISAKLSGDVSYTSERAGSLPTDNAELTNTYSSQDYSDAESDDGTRVAQDATATGYILHQFKKVNSNNTDDIQVSWNGQSSLAPSSATVYLQIYNHNTTSWENLDSNSASNADTDFTLSGSKTSDLSYYYSTDKVVSARVYQEVT